MRRFKFAASCAFGCIVLFAGVAPASHDPYATKVAPGTAVIAQKDERAPRTKDVEPATPGESGTEVPASEPGGPRKPTTLERAKAALAQSSAEALSDEELCTTLLE